MRGYLYKQTTSFFFENKQKVSLVQRVLAAGGSDGHLKIRTGAGQVPDEINHHWLSGKWRLENKNEPDQK